MLLTLSGWAGVTEIRGNIVVLKMLWGFEKRMDCRVGRNLKGHLDQPTTKGRIPRGEVESLG